MDPCPHRRHPTGARRPRAATTRHSAVPPYPIRWWQSIWTGRRDIEVHAIQIPPNPCFGEVRRLFRPGPNRRGRQAACPIAAHFRVEAGPRRITEASLAPTGQPGARSRSRRDFDCAHRRRRGFPTWSEPADHHTPRRDRPILTRPTSRRLPIPRTAAAEACERRFFFFFSPIFLARRHGLHCIFCAFFWYHAPTDFSPEFGGGGCDGSVLSPWPVLAMQQQLPTSGRH